MSGRKECDTPVCRLLAVTDREKRSACSPRSPGAWGGLARTDSACCCMARLLRLWTLGIVGTLRNLLEKGTLIHERGGVSGWEWTWCSRAGSDAFLAHGSFGNQLVALPRSRGFASSKSSSDRRADRLKSGSCPMAPLSPTRWEVLLFSTVICVTKSLSHTQHGLVRNVSFSKSYDMVTIVDINSFHGNVSLSNIHLRRCH